MAKKISWLLVAGCMLCSAAFAQTNKKPFVPVYKGLFNAPSTLIPTAFTPDAPVAGNGDIGIVLGGTPGKLCIYIAKNDCWKAMPGYPDGGLCLPGGINLNIPALEGADFHAEQVLANGTIVAGFKKNGLQVGLKIWVPAQNNHVIAELSVTGGNCEAGVHPWAQSGFGARTELGKKEKVNYAIRHFDSPDLDWPTHVAIALNIVGSTSDSFSLTPAKKITLVAGICSNHENNNYLATAVSRSTNASATVIAAMKKNNDGWWQRFWNESYVSIGDTLLEKYYYGSQYLLACCSRNKRFPPGLCGNSITADATRAWQGDYHTNYNYEATWWACYSSNHIAITDPYDSPVLDYMAKGRENARRLMHCGGVYYPVGIGPMGFSATRYPLTEQQMMKQYGIRDVGLEGGDMFCGQRSNAAFLTTNMFQRFYHTYDKAYAIKVYPYIKAVADFWGDYLVFENGRYNSYNDNFWEVGPWAQNWRADLQTGDTNNTATLGLLKMLYRGIVDMSRFLGVDTNNIEKWNFINEHLYPLPLYKEPGLTRLKATERGISSGNMKRTPPGFGRVMAYTWVFPAGNTGMRLDPALTKILQKEVDRWEKDPGGDPAWNNFGNGFETYFTTAARLGYDPERIIAKLKDRIAKKALPNLWIPQSGGFTETLSAVPSCINEMLLQGYENVIRLFPDWPAARDARFERLRTYGAFLVSAEQKDGRVTRCTIKSEKGRSCVVETPWKQGLRITCNGKAVTAVVNGTDYSFKTKAGSTYVLSEVKGK